ncbi:MAG: undecaprenyl-diphosphatase UppP, partial [Patescibacteria group bacterium]
VEGVTEFLPISSTGHLILVSQLLPIAETDFVKTFTIFIQLGAIMAVVVMYARSWLFKWEIIKKLFVAFLPTAAIGLIFYHLVKTYLLGNSVVVVGALLLGGAALIVFEYFYREPLNATDDLSKISYRQAFIIGLCQSVAIVPGVSRAAATIIGGLALGLKRRVIVEFSFLLAVPTMAAASGLDLLKSAGQLTLVNTELLLVGFVVAFAVAVMAVKFLLKFIKTHNFTAFGWYRIALGLLFWYWLI